MDHPQKRSAPAGNRGARGNTADEDFRAEEPAPTLASLNGSRKWRTALRPVMTTASELQAKVFPPMTFIVEPLIAPGLTLLVGVPKVGKSWLALDVAVAVARGGYTLGDKKADQGDVLVLALEDNERRLQARLTKILGYRREPWPDRLHLVTQWPRTSQGGIELLQEWIDRVEQPTLIVVDVLAAVRPPQTNKQQQAYDADYEAISGLQKLTSTTPGLGLLVLHHARKAKAEADPFERVSGTYGLSGAADAAIVIDRNGSSTTLYARGRDIEEVELSAEFDRRTCRWRILGDASETQQTDERRAVLDALQGAPVALSAREVSDISGRSYAAVRRMLARLAKSGVVERHGRGAYKALSHGLDVPNDVEMREFTGGFDARN